MCLAVLIDVLAHCGNDKLIPTIVWQNLHPLLEHDADRLVSILKTTENDERFAAMGIRAILPRMIDRILAAKEPSVTAVEGLLQHAMDRHPDRMSQAIAAVSARLNTLSEASRSQLKEQIHSLLDRIVSDDLPSPLPPAPNCLPRD